MYTDGSYTASDAKMGYGCLMLKGDDIVWQSKGPVPTTYGSTNNIAELYAINNGLQHILDNITNYSKSQLSTYIQVRTDSEYSMKQSVTLTADLYVKPWNDWLKANQDVKNFVYLQNIVWLGIKLLDYKVFINYVHVYGHNNEKYNEMVDSLANEGRLQN